MDITWNSFRLHGSSYKWCDQIGKPYRRVLRKWKIRMCQQCPDWQKFAKRLRGLSTLSQLPLDDWNRPWRWCSDRLELWFVLFAIQARTAVAFSGRSGYERKKLVSCLESRLSAVFISKTPYRNVSMFKRAFETWHLISDCIGKVEDRKWNAKAQSSRKFFKLSRNCDTSTRPISPKSTLRVLVSRSSQYGANSSGPLLRKARRYCLNRSDGGKHPRQSDSKIHPFAYEVWCGLFDNCLHIWQ